MYKDGKTSIKPKNKRKKYNNSGSDNEQSRVQG